MHLNLKVGLFQSGALARLKAEEVGEGKTDREICEKQKKQIF
jgi:hypothetical protein